MYIYIYIYIYIGVLHSLANIVKKVNQSGK